jgi:hypothetical protein
VGVSRPESIAPAEPQPSTFKPSTSSVFRWPEASSAGAAALPSQARSRTYSARCEVASPRPGRGGPSARLVPVLGRTGAGQDPAGQSARRAAVPDMSIRTSTSSVANRRRALGSTLEKSDIPSPDRRADRADHPQRPPDGTLRRPRAVLFIEPSRARRATSSSLVPNRRAPSRCRPSAAMTASIVAPSGTRPAMTARVSSFSTISSIRVMNSGRNAPE